MTRKSRTTSCWGLALCLASAWGPLRVWGQVDSVEVVPNARYGAGWLQRALLGAHHRDLWTGRLKLEVLSLDRFAGGLSPLCRAADVQTPRIRFRGADGREYEFRSIDRDPATAFLPRALHRSFVAYALQDQMSARHPTAAVVVGPLLAAGAQPPTGTGAALRVMPDDPRLGEHRAPFAGMVGVIVEVPPGGLETTETVWSLIGESEQDRVDTRAYLESRLIDILVGDWERSPERWTWRARADGVGRMWEPVPRSLDHAFARMDGLVLWAARYFVPQLQSFGPSYPSIYGLTWTARALDRRLLVELEKPAWDSVVAALQARLNDSLLTHAVSRLPEESSGGHRAWLLDALKRRRDGLEQAANRFYPLVAQFADVHATERNDALEVERVGDSLVRVRLRPLEEERPYFARTFHRDQTREIRLYLRGGDDIAVVRGAGGNTQAMTVRIVGGGGDDRFVDSSLAGTAATEFRDVEETPTAPLKPATPAAPTHSLPGACPEDRVRSAPPRDLVDPPKDWGSRWYPVPWISFQPNVGLLVGGGAVQYGYGFRKEPFAWRSSITGVFATAPRRVRIWYAGDFRNLPHGLWASVDLRYSGIDIVRFYGFGNETRRVAPAEFYRVTQRQSSASAAVTGLSKRARLSLGPFVGYTDTPLGGRNLIDSLRPYGSGAFTEIGALWRFDLDTRDRTWAPRRGVHASAGARLVPAAFDVVSPYGSVSAEVAFYLTPPAPAAPTLALRAGGMTVWGDAPFAAAAFVGGARTVRGYSEQRFAGTTALYGNAELRVFVRRLKILLPSEVGVLGLGDVGRVYQPGERSRRWHGAVGGGLWVAFVERGSTIALIGARSPEQWSYYVNLGFMF